MTAQNTTHPLTAENRQLTGKQVRQLRLDGKVPAVVYGFQQESLAITVDQKEFTHLFDTVGSTTLIDLSIDTAKPHKVLVHDVQFHPIRGTVQHVDFYQVNMKEKLRTEIPLEFTGEAPAITVEGGSLLVVKDSVEVECLPDALVQEIPVDISVLTTFDDVIRVSSLNVPAGIEILDDPDEMIASVSEPRSEEELAALETEVEDTTDTVEVETGGEKEAESSEEKPAE